MLLYIYVCLIDKAFYNIKSFSSPFFTGINNLEHQNNTCIVVQSYSPPRLSSTKMTGGFKNESLIAIVGAIIKIRTSIVLSEVTVSINLCVSCHDILDTTVTPCRRHNGISSVGVITVYILCGYRRFLHTEDLICYHDLVSCLCHAKFPFKTTGTIS